MYIWQHEKWPAFHWDEQLVANKLARVRLEQGRLLGMMSVLGFDVKSATALDSITADIVTSSEIEGITLDADGVRSSVAWQLGLEQAGLPPSDRYVEGAVNVMFDAVHHYDEPLTSERLFRWHAALFPYPNSLRPITIGKWRESQLPMQVVSGRYGKETVHYEAPPSADVPQMMERFLTWLQDEPQTDGLLTAAIAHLWFVTIHPFSDGNGRLGRTIMDMLLAKADGLPDHFYSMSAAIGRERKAYYEVLEKTQKGNLDITEWLMWFLDCLDGAIRQAEDVVGKTIRKADFWEQHRLTAMNERQTKMVNLLWQGFDGKLTSSKWAKITKCSTDTALRDIIDLMQKGVLVKTEAGGRSTCYELLRQAPGRSLRHQPEAAGKDL